MRLATEAATEAVDIVMRVKQEKIDDPLVICHEDITEHGVAEVHERTYGPRSKYYDSSKPTMSFHLTLNNGQCGWIARSDLEFNPSMLKEIVKLQQKQKSKARYRRKNPINNPNRTTAQIAVSNARRTTAQIAVSNVSTNPRRTNARPVVDHSPALSDLLAKIESCIHNWPNKHLQPVVDDSDFRSSLNGDIEIKCGQRFQQEIKHRNLLKVPCSVCWELWFKRKTTNWDITAPTLMEMFDVLATHGQWAAQATFEFDAPFDVFNSIPLLDKAMDHENSTITVCKRCANSMQHDKVPSTSVANRLFFGERSETMKNMSIPMKLLTCPVRQKAFIVKLVSYGDPKSRQRGVKGTTIAYPQDNALVDLNGTLPHGLDELARSLDIVFVGSTEPTEAQLKKIFRVSSADALTVLEEYRQNGHPAFQTGTYAWNVDELKEHEASGRSLTHLFRHSISRVDDESECKLDQATQSYTNAENNEDQQADPDASSESVVHLEEVLPLPDVDDDISDEEDIVLDRCGMVHSNSVGENRAALKKSAAEALRVGHHEDPVNTYDNPQYWVNSMPWLFPCGTGGAELERPSDLTLLEWVRHCLNYYDDRFRTDPAFLFVVYKCLQVRDRVTKARILSKIMFNKESHKAINAPTGADLQKALDTLTEKSSLFGSDSAEVKLIRELIKNLKVIGKHSRDSVYARDAARGKMLGLVTLYGLPNVFVTINLSDISNPIVSFWNQTMETSFNLDDLMPEFPNKAKRAQMVADDPVHAAQMFHTSIEAFLKAFLGYEQQTGVIPCLHLFRILSSFSFNAYVYVFITIIYTDTCATRLSFCFSHV